MKVTLEYEHERGETVYFIMFDTLQCTTVTMVLANIRGKTEADDSSIVYVVDAEKIKRPEKKRHYREPAFENYFSKGKLYKTPEEAIKSLLNPAPDGKENTQTDTQ